MSQPVSYYLNLSQTPAGQAFGTLLNGATWEGAAAIAQVTSGTVTTRLHLFNDSDGITSAPHRITAEDIIFAVRKNPDSTDLIVLQTAWTVQGATGSEYYEAEVNWDVIAGTWKKGEEDVFPLADITVDGRAVRVPMALQRSAYDSGDVVANPQLYVKTVAQALTSPQQAQALTNLGGTSVGQAVFTAADAAAARTAIGAGTSSFDPASPGPIGATTADTGVFTTLNCGSFSIGNGGTDPLIVGNVETGNVNYYGTNNFRTTTYFGLTGQTYIDADGILNGPSATLDTSTFTGDVWYGANSGTGQGLFLNRTGIWGYDTDYQQVFYVDLLAGEFGLRDQSLTALSGVGLQTSGNFIVGGDLSVIGSINSPTTAATLSSLTVGTLTLANYTLTLGGNVAFNAFGRTLASQATQATARAALNVFETTEINPVARTRIPILSGVWTYAGALNGSGSPSYNTIFSTGWFLFGDSVTANWEARAVNVQGNGQHLPGTIDTIDWTKDWSARVRVSIRCPAKDNNFIALIFGSATTPTSASLVNKGVKVQVRGNTTNNTVEFLAGAYNTAEALGTAVTWPAGTNSATYVNLLFRYVAGTGFYIHVNGSRTAITSVTSQIPTATSVAGQCSTAFYAKSVAGSGTAVTACWGEIEIDHTSRY